MASNDRIKTATARAWWTARRLSGFTGRRCAPRTREARYRERNRRFYSVSLAVHLGVILLSLVTWYGCRHQVPAGVPQGKGEKLAMGKVVVVRTPKRVRRKRKVRKSPVAIYEMIEEHDREDEQRTRQQFSDSVGVPGAVGQGAAAAGSPHGTSLGGKLHFYRIRHGGPNWNANSAGVRPLMKEVLKAGVVKKISGFNNVIPLKKLPQHSKEYLPNLIYMTGTGPIRASNQEIQYLRDYLRAGGMLFADVSGGSFHEHFVRFMKRVFPNRKLREIELDHEIYRGKTMPYAMVRGCPIYRNHRGAGPAMGLWIGPRISVFYSRGDLGTAWGAAGLFKSRKRNVEQAFRMGVNIVSYSLLYYKHGVDHSGGSGS